MHYASVILPGRFRLEPKGEIECMNRIDDKKMNATLETRNASPVNHTEPSALDTFHKILSTAVEGGASDVHLKVGAPIIFRISRRLVASAEPHPTEEWMNSVLERIVPRH